MDSVDSFVFENDTAALFVDPLSVIEVVVAVVAGLVVEEGTAVTAPSVLGHSFTAFDTAVTLGSVLVLNAVATGAFTVDLGFPLFTLFGSGGLAGPRGGGGAFRRCFLCEERERDVECLDRCVRRDFRDSK